nr:retrovirus-related Pol polyprotein from transposon TNT 1-94 [Ipomoea batatas]
MASETGYDKTKEATPKTSDESGEEREKAQHGKVASNATEVLPGCIDVMSPYFLHAFDAPGHIYVIEILRDGNYGEWVNDMRDALFAKNKMGFVDGSLSTPTPDSPYLQQLMRCNAMVKGWLKSAMDRDMRNSIRYANTARDIWVDLEERFGKGSAPRAFEIRRAVVLLRQEKASISSYYTKLKSLWDEMMAISPLPKCVCSGCTCNISKQMADMKEKEQLYDFLMGLDEEFTAVKSHILCSKPTPSLGRAYHMVSEDEQQRQVSATHKPMAEATAFQTQKVFNEKDGRGRRRDKPTCGHCQKIGHTEDQCYEIIGYPAHWRKGLRDKRGGQYIDQKATPKVAHVDADVNPLRSLTQAQMARLVQFLNTDEEKFKHGGASATPSVNMAGKIDKRNTWVIDSGATDHIVCDSNLLNRVELESGDFPVTVPNGDRVAVKSIGSTKLPNGLQINHVLNIPDFKCNLISVGKLTKDYNCTLTFFSDFCILQDLPSRKLIGVGRMCNGLYDLEPTLREGVAMSVNKEDPDVWHRRLGHASIAKIKKIQLDYLVASENNLHCDSCMRAKQSRLPFPVSSIKTKSCFDLIHCDIWGGYKTASFSGAHYFLTIVDDFSRGVWVYLMKHKSEVSHHLVSFCNMISTQFGKVVKQIRADNGMEFRSNYMLDYYKECGIILQRLPSKAIKDKTPYEILMGRKPDYSHLRVFGCLTYVHNRKGDKFDERGKPCIFVGYPNGQKGYRVYNPNDGTFSTTRDLSFIENIFPLKGSVHDLESRAERPHSRLEPMNDEHYDIQRIVQAQEANNGSTEHNQLEVENDCTTPIETSELVDIHATENHEPVEPPVPTHNVQQQHRSQRTRSMPKYLENYETTLPPSLGPTPSTHPSASSTVW